MARRLDLLKGVWVEDQPKKKRDNPEGKVKDAIQDWLRLRGCYTRTIKSDGQKLPGGKWIPSKQGRGISDLIGITPEGRFLAIEVKAPGKEKTATLEQLDFISNIIERGGVGVVASSIAQVEWALSATQEQLRTECRLLLDRLRQA